MLSPICPSALEKKDLYFTESDLHLSGPASGSFGSSLGWPDFPSQYRHPRISSHPQAPPLSSHSGPDPLCPVGSDLRV